jgi:hypothetical protein
MFFVAEIKEHRTCGRVPDFDEFTRSVPLKREYRRAAFRIDPLSEAHVEIRGIKSAGAVDHPHHVHVKRLSPFQFLRLHRRMLELDHFPVDGFDVGDMLLVAGVTQCQSLCWPHLATMTAPQLPHRPVRRGAGSALVPFTSA